MQRAMQIELKVIMTLSVATGTEDMTVRDALKLMRNKKIHHLPVVRKQADGAKTLVGIVSERDLLHATSIFLGTKAEDRKDQATLDIHLKGFMIKRVFTLTPESTVKQAIRLVLDKHIGCLPIVEVRDLVGIVTKTDLLKLLDDFVV